MHGRSAAPPAASPRRRALARTLLLGALLAAPALAQYTQPGSQVGLLPRRKDQLEKAAEQARWRLGSVRVAPWVGVRDVTYVREQSASGQSQRGDLTATGGAGVKLYLPLGPNVMAAAHALPEYTWWQREKNRNATVGRYGLGLFYWFNRLDGELTARRDESVTFLSSDLLVRQPIASDQLNGSAQVRLLGSIALYVQGELDRVRVKGTSGLTVIDPALLLDRDESRVRVGARYVLRSDRGYLGVGALRERTDFRQNSLSSNTGNDWYAEALVRGNHADVSVSYDHRNLKAASSVFPGYSAGNGHATISIHPGWRLQYQLYARRQLDYSAQALDRYLEETRVGAGIHVGLGSGAVQIFYEQGKDDYFGATVVTPSEKVSSYGGWIDFRLFRYLSARLGTTRTRFDPDIGARREIRQIQGALSLTLGQSGDW